MFVTFSTAEAARDAATYPGVFRVRNDRTVWIDVQNGVDLNPEFYLNKMTGPGSPDMPFARPAPEEKPDAWYGCPLAVYRV